MESEGYKVQEEEILRCKAFIAELEYQANNLQGMDSDIVNQGLIEARFKLYLLESGRDPVAGPRCFEEAVDDIQTMRTLLPETEFDVSYALHSKEVLGLAAKVAWENDPNVKEIEERQKPIKIPRGIRQGSFKARACFPAEWFRKGGLYHETDTPRVQSVATYPYAREHWDEFKKERGDGYNLLRCKDHNSSVGSYFWVILQDFAGQNIARFGYIPMKSEFTINVNMILGVPNDLGEYDLPFHVEGNPGFIVKKLSELDSLQALLNFMELFCKGEYPEVDEFLEEKKFEAVKRLLRK